ncbi:mucin-17-like [Gouania willdenowi]|uniref:mucin-17-like n=1 Tax=Gouania willdenowi TaxID=441366 RepID=UPI001054CF1F|nr:mucin-17-like [Gouania willdenowi]
MKLMLFLTLFGALCTTAKAILCYQCIDPNDPLCAGQRLRLCPVQTMCLTASIQAGSPGNETLRLYRNCASTETCPTADIEQFSINLGGKQIQANVRCCGSNACNGQSLPAIASQPSNGFKCLGCQPETPTCKSSVDCTGDENVCFSTTTINGCGSANLCASTEKLNALPLKDYLEGSLSSPTCEPATTTTPNELFCQSCADPSDPLCSNELSERCSSETMCVTSYVRVNTNRVQSVHIYKGCATSSQCPATGSQTYSLNGGSYSALGLVECCDTSNCNSISLSVPASLPVNGRQCHICIPGTTICTFKIRCRGDESRCFQATANSPSGSSTLLGCTSSNVCDDAAGLGTLLQMIDTYPINGTPTCCDGNLCNVFPLTGPSALQCQSCADPSDPLCSSEVTVTCPVGSMCVTSSTRVISPGFPAVRINKGCASSSQCPATGSTTYSVNGISYASTASVQCCDTSSCNSATLPVPPSQPTNSLQCFICIPGTNSCSNRVRCRGDEDRCFTANVTTSTGISPFLGCISASACDTPSSLNTFLHLDQAHPISSGPSCCVGDSCNSVSAVPPTVPTTTAATALQCQSCADPSDLLCSSEVTVTCPVGSMCVTSSTRVISPGFPAVRINKGCASSSQCPATGSTTYSVNGISYASTASVQCCDTSSCNSATLPVPPSQPTNSLQCFICIPGTNSCSNRVRCRGDEDRCFTANVTTSTGISPFLGCISASVCDTPSSLNTFLHLDQAHPISSGPSCCVGDSCNSVSAVPPTVPTTTAATALQCQSCADPSDPLCSIQTSVTCPSGSMCATIYTQAQANGLPPLTVFRGCAQSSQCPATGSFTFSANVGIIQVTQTAECCNSDNCNSGPASAPAPLPLNGQECHACLPGTTQCSFQVQCFGAEDRCFATFVSSPSGTSPVIGCTSSNLCNDASSLGNVLYSDGSSQVVSGPICCQGSLCNMFPSFSPPAVTTTVPPQVTSPALQCQSCADPSDPLCSIQTSVTCPSGSMCATIYTQAQANGLPPLTVFRGCAQSSQCPATGSFTFSANVGIIQVTQTAECCNSDNCNSGPASAPAPVTLNGQLCHVCLPGTTRCSFQIQCLGVEDSCFAAFVSSPSGTSPVIGCTSSNLCNDASSLGNVLYSNGSSQVVSGPICCQGSLCNMFPSFSPPAVTTTVPPQVTSPALQCQSCADPSDPLCSIQTSVTCPSGSMCATIYTQAQANGLPPLTVFRGCAQSSQCPATGSFTFSANVGIIQVTQTAECCNSDNCNSGPASAPAPLPLNGQECHACLPGTTQCSFQVQCFGAEDRCFATFVSSPSGTSPVIGCTSSNLCNDASSLGNVLYSDGSSQVVSGPICCQGSLCNMFPSFSPPAVTTTVPPQVTSPALQCQSCADPSDPLCSIQTSVTCPSGSMCATIYTQAQANGLPPLTVFRGCAQSSQCPATGSFTFSANVGIIQVTQTAECCNSDNCNSGPASAPAPVTLNGQLCHVCLPGTTRCSFQIQCLGVEDSCFAAFVSSPSGTSPVIGCTSSNLCNDASSLGNVLYSNGSSQVVSGPICCQGSLCNMFPSFSPPAVTTTVPPQVTSPALQCQSCADPSDPLCSIQTSVTCPSGSMCATIYTQAQANGLPPLTVFRGCAQSSQCPATGSFTFSANVGIIQVTQTAECCNSDNCNSGPASAPAPLPLNGQECHACLPGTTQCSFQVQCFGAEDRCFATFVSSPSGTSPVIGCTSSNLCNDASSLGNVLYSDGSSQVVSGPICCQGSLCNMFPSFSPPAVTTTVPPQVTSPALQCQSCADPSDPLCSIQTSVTCPSGSMCATIYTQAQANGLPPLTVFRGCAQSSQCPATGSFTFSANVGIIQVTQTAECCNSDNCNSGPASAPAPVTLNGQLCHVCLPGTTRCSFQIQCLGVEDSCFAAFVSSPSGTSPVIGCTSSNLCNDASSLGNVLYSNGSSQVVSGPICCQGSLCNMFPSFSPPAVTTTVPPQVTSPALQCQSCADPSDPLCSIQTSVTCPSGSMCATIYTQAQANGLPPLTVFRGCAQSSQCPATGSFTFSANVGIIQVTQTAECCNSDNCNSGPASAPAPLPLNGQECHACLPGTTQCSFQVQCFGAEDRCFATFVSSPSGTSPVIGCTSSNLCNDASSLGNVLYSDGSSQVVSGPICCQGSLCNMFPSFSPPAVTTTVPPQVTSPALQCQSCADPSDPLCSIQTSVTCPSGSMCATIYTQAQANGLPPLTVFRGCAQSSQCPATGSFTFSANVGIIQVTQTAECCNSDNCNSGPASAPAPLPLNGQECHACLPGTTQCSFQIRCFGVEDRCFAAIVSSPSGTSPVIGCTSSNLCNDASSLGNVLYSDGSSQVVSGPICCQGSLCNTYPSFSPPAVTTTVPPQVTSPALQCQSCADPSDPLCSIQTSVTCPSGSMCATIYTQAQANGLPPLTVFRGCAQSSQCPATGSFTFSANVGIIQVTQTAECCNSDNCNSGPASAPAPLPLNGQGVSRLPPWNHSVLVSIRVLWSRGQMFAAIALQCQSCADPSDPLCSTQTSVTCPSGSMCATIYTQAPAPLLLNGRQCHACLPGTTQCSFATQCYGVEDSCFAALLFSVRAVQIPVIPCVPLRHL